MKNAGRVPVALAVVALAWCVGVGYWMQSVPMMTGGRFPSAGEIAGMVAVPVVAAASATWAARWRRHAILGCMAGLVSVYGVLMGFSFGSAFFPAAGLLALSFVVSVLYSSKSSAPKSPAS